MQLSVVRGVRPLARSTTEDAASSTAKTKLLIDCRVKGREQHVQVDIFFLSLPDS